MKGMKKSMKKKVYSKRYIKVAVFKGLTMKTKGGLKKVHHYQYQYPNTNTKIFLEQPLQDRNHFASGCESSATRLIDMLYESSQIICSTQSK